MIRSFLDREEGRGKGGARTDLPPDGVDTALASLDVPARMRPIEAIIFASKFHPN